MRLSYMREFVLLSSKLNISATAKELFISQSALSRHIKALEDEMGFALVRTDYSGVELTEFGERALQSFKKMLWEYDDLVSGQKLAVSAIEGSLCVGLMYYLAGGPLMDYVNHFRRRYPSVKLTCMSSYQPYSIYEDIVNEKVDVGTFMACRGKTFGDLYYKKAMDISYIVMTRSDSSLTARDTVSLSELAGPAVKLEVDTAYQSSLDLATDAVGFMPQEVVFTDNVETLPYAITQSGGYHITTSPCRRQQAPGIAYLDLIDELPKASLGFAALSKQNPLVHLFFDEMDGFFAAV